MSSFHTASYPSRPTAPVIQRAREHWPALTLAVALAVLIAAALLLVGANVLASPPPSSDARELAPLRAQARALSSQLGQAQAADTQAVRALTTSQAQLHAQAVALTRARDQLAAVQGCARSPRPRVCLRHPLR